MSYEIIVSGASDDLVEIDGDITEEFSYYSDNEEPAYLGFSDGTVLRIIYDETGLWKIVQINEGSADVEYDFKATDSDSDKYSDVVALRNEKIDWLMLGSAFVKRKKSNSKE